MCEQVIHFRLLQGTYGYSEHFDRAMGMITPYSHVSNVFLTYSDDMTYWERCYNTYLSLYEWIFRDWVILPKQDALAKKYFQQIVGELDSKGISQFDGPCKATKDQTKLSDSVLGSHFCVLFSAVLGSYILPIAEFRKETNHFNAILLIRRFR